MSGINGRGWEAGEEVRSCTWDCSAGQGHGRAGKQAHDQERSEKCRRGTWWLQGSEGASADVGPVGPGLYSGGHGSWGVDLINEKDSARMWGRRHSHCTGRGQAWRFCSKVHAEGVSSWGPLRAFMNFRRKLGSTLKEICNCHSSSRVGCSPDSLPRASCESCPTMNTYLIYSPAFPTAPLESPLNCSSSMLLNECPMTALHFFVSAN